MVMPSPLHIGWQHNCFPLDVVEDETGQDTDQNPPELVEDNGGHEGPSSDVWEGVDGNADLSKDVWEGMNGAPGVMHHETQSRGAHGQSRGSHDQGRPLCSTTIESVANHQSQSSVSIHSFTLGDPPFIHQKIQNEVQRTCV